MSQRSPEQPAPDDLSRVADRLRAERPEATAVELDRIKLRALAQAGSARSRPRRWARLPISAPAALLIALLALIGGGAVEFASSGGFKAASSQGSSGSSQYCPPGSQTGGKKQDPRPENCGVALTPGYWKNHQKHAELLLSVNLGNFTVSTFSTAKKIFDGMNCSSTKDQDAVGCLAGHLLASTFNVKNQASNCIQPTIDAANAFLQSIGYTGPTGSYTLTAAQRSTLLQLKDKLDKYNNTGNC